MSGNICQKKKARLLIKLVERQANLSTGFHEIAFAIWSTSVIDIAYQTRHADEARAFICGGHCDDLLTMLGLNPDWVYELGVEIKLWLP